MRPCLRHLEVSHVALFKQIAVARARPRLESWREQPWLLKNSRSSAEKENLEKTRNVFSSRDSSHLAVNTCPRRTADHDGATHPFGVTVLLLPFRRSRPGEPSAPDDRSACFTDFRAREAAGFL